MSNVLVASIKDKLWHKMRADLVQYAPEIASNNLLMCCACGRFLPRDDFNLEHIIPRQALKRDPAEVRQNPATPENIRAKNLLLCKKPLKMNGRNFYSNGCNSWKGRHYDSRLAELFVGSAWQQGSFTVTHQIAATSLGYLAMIAEFGYRAALMQSGVLLRQQFFMPQSYHRDMPVMCQMLLGGAGTSDIPAEHKIWSNPFSFSFERGKCFFVARTFGVQLPISEDPRVPIPRQLRLVPHRFAMRPDFQTAFH